MLNRQCLSLGRVCSDSKSRDVEPGMPQMTSDIEVHGHPLTLCRS